MSYKIDNKKDITVEITDDILKFLYPNSNDILSNMTNSDRLYTMYLLKQYYLKLRNKLGIEKEATFGLEIEFDNANRSLIEELVNTTNTKDIWKVEEDGSLPNGGEIISPLLRDNESSWTDLSKICNIANTYAEESELAGAHIHIGMHILGNNPKYWANFSKLWMAYENIIFRFLNGEYISPRSTIERQAKPISKDLIEDIDRINDRAKKSTSLYILKVLDAENNRKRSVNFTNVSNIEPYKYDRIENKNTIEFRSANGTFNEVIWQNNVNLLVKLLMYAKSDKFNEDIINKRIITLLEDNIPSNLHKYSRVYTDQAIELADLIFDNNLDKIYFLRQYIKILLV